MSRARDLRKRISRELASQFPEATPAERLSAAASIADGLRPVGQSPEAAATEATADIIRNALVDLRTG